MEKYFVEEKKKAARFNKLNSLDDVDVLLEMYKDAPNRFMVGQKRMISDMSPNSTNGNVRKNTKTSNRRNQMRKQNDTNAAKVIQQPNK